MRILSVGEILWDVFDTQEHLGGAPLNLAFHLARLGHEVALLSAAGEDRLGRRALELVEKSGVGTRFIQRTQLASTGVSRVAVDSAGQVAYRIERPAAYDFTFLAAGVTAALKAWNPGFGMVIDCGLSGYGYFPGA